MYVYLRHCSFRTSFLTYQGTVTWLTSGLTPTSRPCKSRLRYLPMEPIFYQIFVQVTVPQNKTTGKRKDNIIKSQICTSPNQLCT